MWRRLLSRCALGVVRGVTLMFKFAEYDEVRVQGAMTNVERWARDGRGQGGLGKEAFKLTEEARGNTPVRFVQPWLFHASGTAKLTVPRPWRLPRYTTERPQFIFRSCWSAARGV